MRERRGECRARHSREAEKADGIDQTRMRTPWYELQNLHLVLCLFKLNSLETT